MVVVHMFGPRSVSRLFSACIESAYCRTLHSAASRSMSLIMLVALRCMMHSQTTSIQLAGLVGPVGISRLRILERNHINATTQPTRLNQIKQSKSCHPIEERR